jgi:20S proteasome subunit alpha 7
MLLIISDSIHLAHDESKDRDYDLELSWVCEESGMKHVPVPKEVHEEAIAYAQVQAPHCSH